MNNYKEHEKEKAIVHRNLKVASTLEDSERNPEK